MHLLVIHAGNAGSGIADEERAVGLGDLGQKVRRHNAVAHVNDRHLRDRAQCGDVFIRGVGAAIERRHNTGVAADDLYILLCVSTAHKDLVERSSCDKAAERMHKGDKAFCGEAGSHTNHVRLGNAAVKQIIGILL